MLVHREGWINKRRSRGETDKQTGWGRSKKDHDKLSDVNGLWEGYSPKRRNGKRKVRKGRITTYDNKARTRETGNGKTLKTEPKMEEERTATSRMQNQKEGVVAWASHLRGRPGSRKDAPN